MPSYLDIQLPSANLQDAIGTQEVIPIPAPSSPYAEVYKTKRRYESKYGNIVSTNPYGNVSTTQFKNNNVNESDTGVLERAYNAVFDKVANIWEDTGVGVNVDGTLGKYVEPLKKDVTVEVRNGKRYVIDNKEFNNIPIEELRNSILNLEDESDARDMLYYDRIDNPDGTVSYKLGTTTVDNYDRYLKNRRRTDVTNLWAKRNSKAKEYERLWHGNEHNLGKRRSDLGQDKEKFGAGYTEIYNEDALSLDGTVSAEKLHSLNISSQQKLNELGLNINDRYDAKGIEVAHKELDKLEAIYGKASPEYKELSNAMSNAEQINRVRELSYTEEGIDLLAGVASGAQQFIAGTADMLLDAVLPNDSTLLNKLKSVEYADDVWNYESREEVNRTHDKALRQWKKGDWGHAVFTASTTASDVVAQSLADMGAMSYGAATGLAGILNPLKNKGLAVFAAKQTNNQIDDRIQNNRVNGIRDPEGVGIGTILAMSASNYYLGALDRLAFGSTLSPARNALEKGVLAVLPDTVVSRLTAKTVQVASDLATAGAVEASQELLQSYGEALNSKYGTEAYAGEGLLSDAFVDDAIKGSLAGFGAGVLTHGVASTYRNLAGNVATDVNNAVEDIQTPPPAPSAYADQTRLTFENIVNTDYTGVETDEVQHLVDLRNDIIKSNDPTLAQEYNAYLTQTITNAVSNNIDLTDVLGSQENLIEVVRVVRDADGDLLSGENNLLVKSITKAAEKLGLSAEAVLSVVSMSTIGEKETQNDIDSSLVRHLDNMFSAFSTGDSTYLTSVKSQIANFDAKQAERLATLDKHTTLAIEAFKKDPNLQVYTIPSDEYQAVRGDFLINRDSYRETSNSFTGVERVKHLIFDTRRRLSHIQEFFDVNPNKGGSNNNNNNNNNNNDDGNNDDGNNDGNDNDGGNPIQPESPNTPNPPIVPDTPPPSSGNKVALVPFERGTAPTVEDTHKELSTYLDRFGKHPKGTPTELKSLTPARSKIIADFLAGKRDSLPPKAEEVYQNAVKYLTESSSKVGHTIPSLPNVPKANRLPVPPLRAVDDDSHDDEEDGGKKSKKVDYGFKARVLFNMLRGKPLSKSKKQIANYSKQVGKWLKKYKVSLGDNRVQAFLRGDTDTLPREVITALLLAVGVPIEAVHKKFLDNVKALREVIKYFVKNRSTIEHLISNILNSKVVDETAIPDKANLEAYMSNPNAFLTYPNIWFVLNSLVISGTGLKQEILAELLALDAKKANAGRRALLRKLKENPTDQNLQKFAKQLNIHIPVHETGTELLGIAFKSNINDYLQPVRVVSNTGNSAFNSIDTFNSVMDLVDSAYPVLRDAMNSTLDSLSNLFDLKVLNSSKEPNDALALIVEAEKVVNPQNKGISFVKRKFSQKAVAAIAGRSATFLLENYRFLNSTKTTQELADMLFSGDTSLVTPEIVKEYLGKGMYMNRVANRLGIQVLEDLGIKQKANTPMYKYSALASAIGSIAIATLQSQGVVKISSVKIGEKSNAKMVAISEAFENDAKTLSNMLMYANNIAKAYEEALEVANLTKANLPQATPPKPAKKGKETIKNSDTNALVSDEDVDTMNAQKKVGYILPKDTRTLLQTLNYKTLQKYMGFIEETSQHFKEANFIEKLHIKGVNRTIEQSLLLFNGGMEQLIDMPSFEHEKGWRFYFDRYLGNNYRNYISSSIIQPQSDPFIRFIVQPEGTVDVTVDITDADAYFNFKYAVAQGMGFKTDGKDMTLQDIENEFDRIVEIPYATYLADLYSGKTEGVGRRTLGHYINALLAIKAFQERGINTKFKTSALLEVDHKTSGFAIKNMQYPHLLGDKGKALQQVGVVTGVAKDIVINRDLEDAYQSNVKNFVPELANLQRKSEKGENGEEVFEDLEHFNQKQEVVDALVEADLLPFYTGGAVSGTLRNLIKNPFMVFNYSAGLERLGNVVSRGLYDEVLEKIFHDTEKYENVLEAIVSTSNFKNVDELLMYGRDNVLDLKVLFDGIYHVYADSMAEQFKNNYKGFMEVNNEVNLGFAILNKYFVGEYEKFTNKNPNFSKEELTAWLEENRAMIPHIKTSNGGVLEISETERELDYRYNTNVQFKKGAFTVDGQSQTNFLSRPVIRHFGDIGAAGAVLPIQRQDSVNIGRTSRAFPEYGTDVFDAYVTTPIKATEIADFENQGFYDMNKDYNILKEIVTSLMALPDSFKSKPAIKALGVKDTIGTDIANINRFLVKRVDTPRRKIFYEQPMTIENFVFKGGVVVNSDTNGNKKQVKKVTYTDEDLDNIFNSQENLEVLEKHIDSLPDSNNLTDQVKEVSITVKGKTSTHTVLKATRRGDEVTLELQNKATRRKQTATYVIDSVEPMHGNLELSEPLSISHNITVDTVNSHEKLGSQTINDNESTRIKVIDDLSSNIDAMVNMVDTLRDSTDTDTHIAWLKSLIKELGTKGLNPTALFIDEVSSESKGSFNLNTNEIVVERPIAISRNRQSASTVYVHELVHAFTVFAFRLTSDTRMTSLVRRLYEVYDRASKVLTVSDFINSNNPDRVDALEKAQKDYNYVMTNRNRNGLTEFIAFALTNPKVRTKLSSTLLGKPSNEDKSTWVKLINLYRKVVGVATGTKYVNSKNKSVSDNLLILVKAINASNHRAEYASRKSPSMLRVLLGKSNEYLKDMIEYLVSKVAIPDGKMLPSINTETATKGQKIVWFAKVIPSLLFDKRFKGQLSTLLDAFRIRPDGFVQSILGRMRTIEKYSIEEELDTALRLATNVDERKQEIRDIVASSIKTSFKGELTKDLDKDLKEVLVDLDMSVYSSQEVLNFLVKGDKKINEELEALDEILALQSGRNYKWVKAQTDGLAEYLVTHKATLGVNLNAENIYKGIHLHGAKISRSNITSTIDKLASLKALQLMPESQRNRLGSFLEGHMEGLDYSLAVMRTMKKEAKEKNLKSMGTAIIKGYSVELKDYGIDVKIQSLSETKGLQKEGYRLVKTLSNDIVGNAPFGVFVAEDYARSSYLRGSVLLGNLMSKGTTLTKLLILDEASDIEEHKVFVAKLNLKLTKASIRMYKTGKIVKPLENSLDMIPVLNSVGKIVDYRFVMSKQDKINLLNMDTRASEVLGATRAAVHAKVNKLAHNRKVMEIISQDMLEHAPSSGSLGSNSFRYIKIGKMHNTEIYEVLPKEFLEYINKFPKQYIQVRHDLVHYYFGYQTASILNNKMVRTKLSKPVLQYLQMFKKVEEDAVGLYKNIITTKTLDVIVGNSESNMVQLMQLGYSPVEVTKAFFNEALNTVTYMKLRKEEAELSLAVDNGTASPKDVRRQNHLKEQLKHPSNSNIQELLDNGYFSNIAEEVDLSKERENTNSITKRTDKLLNRLPAGVRVGIEQLYIARNTNLYKVLEDSVHYSDFIARVVYNSFLLKDGMSKRDRMIRLSEAFVNYNIPYSKTEEWLNRKGVINFSKYAFGVQRSINRIKNDSPLYGILSLILQHTVMDMEDISEQFLFNRSWRNFEFSPLEMLSTLLVPSVVENVVD